MSGRVIRLSFAVATALIFLVLWAAIAAHPWTSAKHAAVDPRLAALTEKQRRLQHEAVQVRRLLGRRWAVYGRRLSAREREIALVKSRHVRELALAQAAKTRIASELAARALAAEQAAAQRTSLVSATTTTAAAAPSRTSGTTGGQTPTTARKAPATTAAAAAAPAAVPAPAPAPPPVVAVVTTPPVTTTQSSTHN